MLLSETIGARSGRELLELLFDAQSLRVRDLGDRTQGFAELARAGIVFQAADRLYLTRRGRECRWLLYGMNSGKVVETVRQLLKLYPRLIPYELVTEGMTQRFIDDLCAEYDFKRLLICSPWVSLDREPLRRLSYALYRAQEANSRIDFIVITRPIERLHPFYLKCGATLDVLRALGAEVVFRARLHSKLYIRERSARGGTSQAVFGSENLTGARNLELGIRINNDTTIIRQLSRYFFDLYVGATTAEGGSGK